jgi:hypothetical protein
MKRSLNRLDLNQKFFFPSLFETMVSSSTGKKRSPAMLAPAPSFFAYPFPLRVYLHHHIKSP